MDLTETQFRLLKSGAKKRFAELGQDRTAGKQAVVGTAVVSRLQRYRWFAGSVNSQTLLASLWFTTTTGIKQNYIDSFYLFPDSP